MSGLMPLSSFGSLSQQVLQSESQTSCQLSLPAITSPSLVSSSAPDYCVLTWVPESTQSKITLSSVKSITQGPCRRTLVHFSRIKSEQSKTKNRRLLSFHTKPAVSNFSGGFCSCLMLPMLRFSAR